MAISSNLISSTPNADFNRGRDGAPLYYQVKNTIEAQILSGQYRKGDFLPPEPELCRIFAVSAITVRRALLELARDGLIRRQGGIGTYVSSETKRIKFALVFVGFDDADWLKRGGIFGSLLSGIGDAAWHANADFSTVRTDAAEDAMLTLKVLIDDRQVDGVLLRTAGDVNTDYLTLLESRGVPYVVVKRHIEGRPMNFVTIDDVDAAFRATTHLIKLGHRRIGLVMGPHDISPRRGIFAGYRRAIEEHGLTFDERIVHFTIALPDEGHGYTSMEKLLSEADRPTAVIAASSSLAIGITDAISRAGLRIPDDIALVGYGDLPSAMAVRPALTMISTAYDQIGRLAAETLFHLVARPQDAPKEVFVPAPLVVRASCGADRSYAHAGPEYL
jgi:DNA-binding LacI/PurR family transcriptional regulator